MDRVYVLNFMSYYYDGDGFVLWNADSFVHVCKTMEHAKSLMEESIKEELDSGYTPGMLSRDGELFAKFCDRINGNERLLYTAEITEQNVEQ